MKIGTSKFLEWAQMFTGCSAAMIVSLNLGDTWVFWSMCLFLIKDSMMGIFAYMNKYPGIVTSSIVYAGIDLLGIYRWWIF
jgi:uncharacterized membrane protein